MTSPQMVVYVGNSPPTTLFQVGEILYFTQYHGNGKYLDDQFPREGTPVRCQCSQAALEPWEADPTWRGRIGVAFKALEVRVWLSFFESMALSPTFQPWGILEVNYCYHAWIAGFMLVLMCQCHPCFHQDALQTLYRHLGLDQGGWLRESSKRTSACSSSGTENFGFGSSKGPAPLIFFGRRSLGKRFA